VITAADARLWTDGRYFLQAELQLDSGAGWKLMKVRLKHRVPALVKPSC
jgi:hypothetical protein